MNIGYYSIFSFPTPADPLPLPCIDIRSNPTSNSVRKVAVDMARPTFQTLNDCSVDLLSHSLPAALDNHEDTSGPVVPKP